ARARGEHPREARRDRGTEPRRPREEERDSRRRAMIDPRLIRQDTAAVASNLARRGFHFDAGEWQELDRRRKSLQLDTESLRKQKNDSARTIGGAKQRGEPIEPLLAAVQGLGEKLEAAEQELRRVQERLREIELGLPNLLDDDVPDGADASANVELRRWG